jgi:hypothetical protein
MSISFYPRFLRIEHILKGKTKTKEKENRKEQRTKEIKKINKNKK